MDKTFNDHFASVSAHYADSRPTYPDALFEWLAGLCARRELAWDCGAGNGQASVALTPFFERVIATDASAAQIAQVHPHPHVEYRVAPAEQSGLDDASSDLVIVAQALHWFDPARFHAEVRRVLRPDGVIAAWSYGVLRVEGDDVDALVQRFYRDDIGPCWPPERRHVETGYRDIAFPYARVDAPAFAMRLRWSMDQLLGYFRSWSATARFVEANGRDPVAQLAPQLRACWGEPDRLRIVEWPLAMLVGRVPAG